MRDGADLVVDGYDFAPTFSIWTTIEECLNPPVIYERERGWFTTEPFSEPEIFTFPHGIGPLKCVNVEHEEVILIPRWIDVERVTFKYGLGDEFINVLKTLQKLELVSTDPVEVRGVKVSPRDVVAAALPDPAELGDKMHGRTCAGTWVKGIGKDGNPREVYVYHIVDNAWSMKEFGHQAVVWQTAVMPAVAIELMATGQWFQRGIVGPEALPSEPFLDLLDQHGMEWDWAEYKDRAPAPEAERQSIPAAGTEPLGRVSGDAGESPRVGERVVERPGERLAGPRDVERRAVVDRRADDRQAERDVHAGVERHQLHRRVPLVVVHHDDRVVAVPVHRLEEHGVGRVRPAGRDARCDGRGDRGSDVLGVLAAEQPVLPRVRVEPAHRDPR